jgi:hypothetical protein
MRFFSLILAFALVSISARADTGTAKIAETTTGLTIGRSADLLAFHGATPVAIRAGAAQAAVTATVGAALPLPPRPMASVRPRPMVSSPASTPSSSTTPPSSCW